MTVFLLCLTSTGGLVLLLFKQTNRSSDIVNNRKYQQKLNNKYQQISYFYQKLGRRHPLSFVL